MTGMPLSILGTGMVSAVGLTAPATCAAIRARLSNPRETRCRDAHDEWITAHQVPFEAPRRGVDRLVRMAVAAVHECLAAAGATAGPCLPMLLCVAEPGRPGRAHDLEDRLPHDIAAACGDAPGVAPAMLCHGRTGVAVALRHARERLYGEGVERVLVVATDSLVTRRTLAHYERQHRLVTRGNSNGFVAGEAACAFLVGRPTGRDDLLCTGLGFAVERAHIESGEPLRADGLVQAHRAALEEAGLTMDEVDYRVCDLSGEHYHFKESHFAFTRLRRQPEREAELWHPAQSTGACGAALGGVCLALAHAAAAKGYAPGRTALLHFSDDDGRRASIVCTGG